MLNAIIVLNVALLVTHQIDAAYWREWEMFRIPGGIQVFVVVNAVLFTVILGCLGRVFRREPAGYGCSVFIGVLSALVLPIHAAFAFAGFEQFAMPVSIAVIAGSFLTAVAQLVLTVRHKADFLDA